MTTPQVNILNLPIEDLWNIFSHIPYEKLQNLCNTSQLTRIVCQNRYFWIHKAEIDFGTSPQEFNEVNIEPRERYLQLRRTFSEKPIVDFLREIFNLGMYLRGWSGHPAPYPLLKSQTMTQMYCDPNINPGVATSLINVYQILNDASNDIKSILMKIPIMKYVDKQFTMTSRGIRDTIGNVLNKTINGSYCSRAVSNNLIATAIYYLQNNYGIIIPWFDIDVFERL